ncbi:MAG TPA: universal stress protein [Gemmatimonadaceae bacterium]|nr:universal stress protein [Gemmatimonadaceae bacterium]
MYSRILVPLEHSAADATILAHVRKLAQYCKASVVLIHVADGWAARNALALNLRESEEMRSDRTYLEDRRAELEAAGIEADAVLARGDPPAEILSAAAREGADLIAMATHGHRFLNDLVRGTVANEVRHRSPVPVLLVRSTGTESEDTAAGKDGSRDHLPQPTRGTLS